MSETLPGRTASASEGEPTQGEQEVSVVKEAKELARAFLSQRIELDICDDPPEGLYGFDQATEFLFAFRLFGACRVDGTQYVAVSKLTGTVRHLN